MRIKADLTLLFVAIIWGSAFAAQRIAAEYVGPFLFNGSRFLLGALLLLPLIRFRFKLKKSEQLWVLAAGSILCAASVLQQAGLKWTTAGNAGFITGLYVVFIPVILLVIFKERLHWLVWAAAFLAAFGIFLLSANGTFQLAPGDGLELIGAVLWAAHVVVIGQAMKRMDPMRFAIGQYLVAGVLNLLIALVFERQTIPGMLPAWWTIVYVGLFSVAIGYTLQGWALKYAPPTDASLILSLESVFAAVFGFIFLQEVLLPIQLLGAGLILGAILLSQFVPSRELT